MQPALVQTSADSRPRPMTYFWAVERREGQGLTCDLCETDRGRKIKEEHRYRVGKIGADTVNPNCPISIIERVSLPERWLRK